MRCQVFRFPLVRHLVAGWIGVAIGLSVFGLLWVLYLYVPLMLMWAKLLVMIPLMILIEGCNFITRWLITKASEFRL